MTGCYEGDGGADRDNSREVSGGSKVTFCALFSRERTVRGVDALTGIMLTPTYKRIADLVKRFNYI